MWSRTMSSSVDLKATDQTTALVKNKTISCRQSRHLVSICCNNKARDNFMFQKLQVFHLISLGALFICFGTGSLSISCPEQPQSHAPPTSVSWGSGIIGMCYYLEFLTHFLYMRNTVTQVLNLTLTNCDACSAI